MTKGVEHGFDQNYGFTSKRKVRFYDEPHKTHFKMAPEVGFEPTTK